MNVDVVVVGGGIVGKTAAIELAKSGAQVSVVDAGINSGSDANAGSLHVQMQSRFMRLYPEQVPNIEASLSLYCDAVEEWKSLQADVGSVELVQKGGLMLAEDDGQLAFLEKKVEREVRKGVTAEILDRSALEKIAPWLGSDIVGAELCRNEGKVNPLVANSRLRARADELGVRFINDKVRALSVSDHVEAHGDAGSYRCDRILLAAAWGVNDLVSGFGVSIPSRAEPLHMNITETCSARFDHLVQHAEKSITLKQFGSGQIVIGGGWPARSRGLDRVPEVELSSLLGNIALAARLVPSVGQLRIIRTWAGMNTTNDGASIIGPLAGNPRVVIAVPGDAGYTLGPLVAKMATAGMLGNRSFDEDPRYSPARFAA